MVVQVAGPWVTMAVLCQNVVPNADGTVDVLGIVDGVVVEPEGHDALGLHPAAHLAMTAVVSLRAGDQRGSHVLALRAAYPTGAEGPTLQRNIEFSDDMPAATLVVPLDMDIHEPGVYAFDVFYDGARLTRMALWVTYRHPS